ncbi:MAG: SPOR domain-containing protein [Burkholderiaceae bacterium]|nr:SPOR domain-containing protein [Burkholderiaceae bacterium]
MRLPASGVKRSAVKRSGQRGGFILGLIVGLLAGLAVALGVALYVTKVPVPFINKVPQRNPELDAAQAEKDRNWDPNAPLAGKSATRPAAGASGAVSPSAANAADVARGAQTPAVPGAMPADAGAASAVAAVLPVTYYVQAGAYARSDDAEQQRASLGLLGMSAKVTEREQAGRTVYRVRVGPFERKEDADAAKERLTNANIDAALVRVQR